METVRSQETKKCAPKARANQTTKQRISRVSTKSSACNNHRLAGKAAKLSSFHETNSTSLLYLAPLHEKTQWTKICDDTKLSSFTADLEMYIWYQNYLIPTPSWFFNNFFHSVSLPSEATLLSLFPQEGVGWGG